MTHDIDPSATRLSRRNLLGAATATAIAAGLGCQREERRAEVGSGGGSLVAAGDLVLFQGDSITDAGRSREQAAEPNSQPALGNGYAWLAAAGLLVARHDEDIRVFNRGISGHKVPQLTARWDADCLDLAPDVLSILIGVNDIWHTKSGNYDGTVVTYERDYQALVARTRAALPEMRLVVCEPFVLRCGAIDDSWFPEFDEYRAAARRVADTNGATWVGFQAMFDRAVELAPPEHWAKDGVHPSSAGAALMADTWLAAVRGA
ncbi:MAG TPA: SGNH/GDSL hydrolase family protein [Planctomycetota bacterium]